MKMATGNNSRVLSEPLYSKIIDSSPDAIFIYVDEIIIFTNNAGAALLGAKSPSEITGRKVWDFVPDEDIPAVRRGIEKFINQERTSFISDDRVKRLDGKVLDVELSSSYFPCEGRPGVLAFFRDITKRKKAEESLRRSENIYRTIFETTGTAMFFIEEDTVISLVNSESEKMSGFTKKQIEGKMSWSRFVSDCDLPRLKQYHELRRTRPGAAPRDYEFVMKNKQGKEIHVYMTIAIVPGTQQSVASLIDISELKKSQLELAASEEKYRLLAENARDIIIFTDINGSIVYMNSAAKELTGLSDDLLKDMSIVDLLPSSRNVFLRKKLREKKMEEGRAYINKAEIRDRKGNPVTLETMSNIIKVGDELKGVLVTGRDITERSRLEREIMDISERIRLQVGRDLHDDLSPHLLGIEALASVLKKKLEQRELGDETYDIEKIRYLINEATVKTRRLIQGLCPVDIDARGLISALYNLAERPGTIYGIDCTCECDRNIIIGDHTSATNLYYIAQEAVYNAARHSGCRNIHLYLQQVQRASETHILLEITDDGHGIPVHTGHTGMGLQIMKYRAEIINGSLEIDSGKGTTIRCYVPLQQ